MAHWKPKHASSGKVVQGTGLFEAFHLDSEANSQVGRVLLRRRVLAACREASWGSALLT